MNSKFILLVFTSGLLASVLLFMPSTFVHAQGDCGVDASGAPIPCPTEKKERTRTPVPVIITFTPTNTPTNTPSLTSTATASATLTATKIPDTATPTITATSTNTPTPTPVPVVQSVLPGAGIGALILFLIVGLLLPAIQKIRVARRGY